MSKNAFAYWWHNTGSGMIPGKDEEAEQHAERVAEAAWDAVASELNERIEELEYEIRDLASRYDS
jgi:uncharacterized protein YceH (UPF0502 family)